MGILILMRIRLWFGNYGNFTQVPVQQPRVFQGYPLAGALIGTDPKSKASRQGELRNPSSILELQHHDMPEKRLPCCYPSHFWLRLIVGAPCSSLVQRTDLVGGGEPWLLITFGSEKIWKKSAATVSCRRRSLPLQGVKCL